MGLVQTQSNSVIDHTDRAWLIEQYVANGLDCVQIGALVGRDPKTIWYWLKKFGVETRPRGSYRDLYLPKGRPAGYHHTEESKVKIRASTIADGRVPYLRDGKHWLKDQSGEVNPNWKGGITPERQEFYRSKEWKQAVAIVWNREDAHCQRCALDYRTVDRKIERFHVHHIVPFAVKELRVETYNLALLCRECHNFVHSKANILFLFIAIPLPSEVQITEVAA